MAQQKGSLKRKVLGAGALGLVALGVWLGQYFPGFGLGKGLGFGTGSTESTGQSKDEKAGPQDGSSSPSATVVSHQTTLSAAQAPERLRVIIDGDHFILASGEAGTAGRTLDATEIAQLAKATTGDDQGIRIRIERTKRATAGAKQTLFEALDAAGITRDSRHESTEFLDTAR